MCLRHKPNAVCSQRFTRYVVATAKPRAGHAPPLQDAREIIGGAVRREWVGGASKNVS